MPIVVVFPGVIEFLIRGKRIEEMVTQELVDLAVTLARNPELRDLVDNETLTIRERKGGRR